jgi:hypothetical protein
MSERKGSATRLAGFHLEWEFAQTAIENLACDGHPLRVAVVLSGPVMALDMFFRAGKRTALSLLMLPNPSFNAILKYLIGRYS